MLHGKNWLPIVSRPVLSRPHQRGEAVYLQLELFCIQLSFFAYSPSRPLLDALSHCMQKSPNCKQKSQNCKQNSSDCKSKSLKIVNCKSKSSTVSTRLPTASKKAASHQSVSKNASQIASPTTIVAVMVIVRQLSGGRVWARFPFCSRPAKSQYKCEQTSYGQNSFLQGMVQKLQLEISPLRKPLRGTSWRGTSENGISHWNSHSTRGFRNEIRTRHVNSHFSF